jgi:hypothetical protein
MEFSPVGCLLAGVWPADPVADLRRIAGGSITDGIVSAGPYMDFYGDQCSGTTHFVAQWFANYTL